MKLAECKNGHDVRLTTRIHSRGVRCEQCATDARTATKKARPRTDAEQASGAANIRRGVARQMKTQASLANWPGSDFV